MSPVVCTSVRSPDDLQTSAIRKPIGNFVADELYTGNNIGYQIGVFPDGLFILLRVPGVTLKYKTCGINLC